VRRIKRVIETGSKKSRGCDITDLTPRAGGYYESLREDMLKYIPGGTRTSLEFGCGFGGFSAQLKRERGIETWGVEINAAAAAEAAKSLDKVIVADAFEAINKLPDNYFDCIVFLDVLEHLVNPYAVLLAIKPKIMYWPSMPGKNIIGISENCLCGKTTG